MGIGKEYILFRIKINDILDHPPPPHEWGFVEDKEREPVGVCVRGRRLRPSDQCPRDLYADPSGANGSDQHGQVGALYGRHSQSGRDKRLHSQRGCGAGCARAAGFAPRYLRGRWLEKISDELFKPNLTLRIREKATQIMIQAEFQQIKSYCSNTSTVHLAVRILVATWWAMAMIVQEGFTPGAVGNKLESAT